MTKINICHLFVKAHPYLPERSPKKLIKLSSFLGLSGGEF
jgi:hypothetical protein